MKQVFIIILVTLLHIANTSAQQFFSSGRVITSQGDTLQGEVRAKGNKLIFLRANSRAPERSYTPDQLKSYTTEGVNHIAALLTEEGITNHLFLRERIKGYISLYSLDNPEGELAYVLQLPDQSFVPLRGKMAWTLLNRSLTECTDPAFLARLESHRFFYDYSYFEQIVIAYNRCVKPGELSSLTKSPFHYEVGAILGVVRNRWDYSFVSSNPYFNPNGLYPVYNTFVLGGFLTLMPRKRLSLMLEALFTQYKGGQSTVVTNPLDPTFQDYRYYSFQEQFLALPITARYVFLNRALRWYIKAGVGFTYSLTLTGHISGNNLVDTEIQMRNGLSIGYLLGLGIDIPLATKRRLYAELRTLPHIIKDGPTHIGDFRSAQLIVGMPLFTH
ncbi:hypothetical protein GO755_24410 [Spirosoma sp. HMF4905]|uniref:PorT family protein n=1 Tax=Spirosoma arboris TaxID=2682092 RepID=A0A7K1SHZ1_9BACT|nr:hypothetical protein [Spirosoma arboris]MVM33206.1 hypothetical protein [Spirosoma arboris]